MQQPGWWPHELVHAGDEHLDPEYVSTYDRKSATDPSEDVRVLRAMGIDESSVIVDLGAGTGTFALAVAPYCQRVVAVDISPAMLTLLRARIEQAGMTNIEVVRAGLLTYEHQGARADAIYSRNVLHHLSDFWKVLALKRAAALLRPGGILRLHDLVFACEPAEVEGVIEDWLAHAATRPEDGWTRVELETHIRTEYSTFTWLLEPMLARAGFTIQDANYRPARPYAAYTCVRQ
jgi:ubiquinone/menaquinone biosynthesis C-methylase UbiE